MKRLGLVVGSAVLLGGGLTACGDAGGSPASVDVVSGQNTVPVADAGQALVLGGEILSGGEVSLDGRASFDPDGDALGFLWRQVEGPSVALRGADTAQPSFDAPRLDATLVFELVVNDGEAYSTPIFMEIDLTEKETNAAPVVLVSPDAYFSQASPTCSTDAYGNCTNCPNCDPKSLAVDAFGTSDPDGDPVVISWSVLSGPSGAGLGEETGEENTVSVPGPPGSCSATVNTNTIVVRATATDCSGDTGFRDITIVYDCG